MEIRMNEQTKTVADVASITALVAVFLQWVPHLTALLSLIWIAMRMVEGIPKFLDACNDLKRRWNGRKPPLG